MSHKLRLITEADAPDMVKLFNHFALHTFAAYPSVAVDESMYHRLKGFAGEFPFYVVEDESGTMIGFALTRRYHMADTMSRVGEITIFLSPDNTHHGIGTAILKQLEADARAHGVDILLASASSRNEASLNFQKRNGFVECGRFKRVGRKFGEEYDMVWMQKFL